MASSAMRFSRVFLRFKKSSSNCFFTRASSFVVGPRKLMFGKKTDLELLAKMMKLQRHEKFRNSFPSSCRVELLANSCEDMDYKMVRIRQPFFLHYRVELLLQRVQYMETLKFTPRQKRKEVERHPPVLILRFAPEDYSVSYLRGLLYCGEDEHFKSKFVHLLYRCVPKQRSYSFRIEGNLNIICRELGITNHCALRLAINMPCFLLWNVGKEDEKFRLIHRGYGLPLGYNLDLHTAVIFPPILNPSLKLNYNLLTNRPDEKLAMSLEMLPLSNVLRYEFSLWNDQCKPEDLSAFLIANSRAEGVNENSDL